MAKDDDTKPTEDHTGADLQKIGEALVEHAEAFHPTKRGYDQTTGAFN